MSAQKPLVFTSLWLCLVIAARPSSIPYLSALLPSELELQALEETDSSEQDDQTDSENTAGNMINVSLHYWKLHWSVNRFWGCCCSGWGYFKMYTPQATQYRNRWQFSHVGQQVFVDWEEKCDTSLERAIDEGLGAHWNCLCFPTNLISVPDYCFQRIHHFSHTQSSSIHPLNVRSSFYFYDIKEIMIYKDERMIYF